MARILTVGEHLVDLAEVAEPSSNCGVLVISVRGEANDVFSEVVEDRDNVVMEAFVGAVAAERGLISSLKPAGGTGERLASSCTVFMTRS